MLQAEGVKHLKKPDYSWDDSYCPSDELEPRESYEDPLRNDLALRRYIEHERHAFYAEWCEYVDEYS